MARAVNFMVSSSDVPLRLVSLLSLGGAFMNVIYSFYVLLIAAFKAQVAEGWVSTSLQLSGMFFLISLTLFFIGEYLLKTSKSSSQSPANLLAQEFSSTVRHFKRRNVTQAGGIQDRVGDERARRVA